MIGPVDFSLALLAAKKGAAILREGWKGKDMLVKVQYPDANSKMTAPYLYMDQKEGARCPWVIGQFDVMSEDWYIYEVPA